MSAALARVFEAGWEMRRRAYARGWRTPERVGARVVSIGNLTVGGTGKTTLVLHLAALAAARGERAAVVLRSYRPGPSGEGDEELMLKGALPETQVFAGRSKRESAKAASAAGHRLILVDDGFSHWPLARDLDVVLLDSGDLLGGGRLLPAGRLREPLRALQRAGVVVVTRLAPGADPGPIFERVRRLAPAAQLAAGRHAVEAPTRLESGAPLGPGRVWILTATGNPAAVERSAREAGLEVAGMTTYRDHHWFTSAEAEAARARAGRAGARLLLTAKDAVRWPGGVPPEGAGVLPVRWEWVAGGEAVEARVFGGEAAPDRTAGGAGAASAAGART